ncbi:TPA: tRNA (adenosine(37)-N6)-threonylcarbamoyltransferase complex transferase subunit TsaD [Candidatus Poribacteria bacterium]|nr:tRNA (adenosine(37)-N6)-threonylcarbamoyltransferase complex transferase subunit TsaD [Candidatus Poribacteria bacterium]
MLILGIDTSCDDTAAAVVADGVQILSNIISSQTDFHRKYGGIVPEIASRKHIELILHVIDEALSTADVTCNDLGAIAVTNRPGLVGSLLVGVAAAKSIAYCYNLSLLGIHHIEGHIYANFLEHDDIPFPHVCLTVSGGHTLLVYVKEDWQYELLGGTQDDAAGEAYDKVSQYLNLGFPGGPIIDKLAQSSQNIVDFPRPMLNSGDYNFSFSGLKTAVRYFVAQNWETGSLPKVEDIVAGFQEAVVDVLVQKTMLAAESKHVSAVTLTGGVAANSELRQAMSETGEQRNIKVYFPSRVLCTDNAAMIAGIAYHKYQAGERAGLDLNAMASAGLDV